MNNSEIINAAQCKHRWKGCAGDPITAAVPSACGKCRMDFSREKNPEHLRGNPDPRLFRLMPEKRRLSPGQDRAARPLESFGAPSRSARVPSVPSLFRSLAARDLQFQGCPLGPGPGLAWLRRSTRSHRGLGNFDPLYFIIHVSLEPASVLRWVFFVFS